MKRAILLFKKPAGWFVGGAKWGNTRAHGKKWVDGFRVGVMSAAAESNDVRVCFNEPFTGSTTNGVSFTVNGGTRNIVPTPTVDGNCIIYTLDGAAFVEGDVIVFTYDAAVGDLTGTISEEELESGDYSYKIPIAPVIYNSWSTESNGVWNMESNDTWILEDN